MCCFFFLSLHHASRALIRFRFICALTNIYLGSSFNTAFSNACWAPLGWLGKGNLYNLRWGRFLTERCKIMRYPRVLVLCLLRDLCLNQEGAGAVGRGKCEWSCTWQLCSVWGSQNPTCKSLEAYVFVGVGSSTYSITFNFMAIRQKQRKP